jgi:hypothetical protein
MHPVGVVQSIAGCVVGNQQVGYVQLRLGGDARASLWSGTASSWVNLNPAGSTYSIANATDGHQQVGIATFAGLPRASLWSGSAESWVDLHAFLPSDFAYSEARAIVSDGAFRYVSGSGFNTITNRQEALLWVQPIPSPSGIALLGICTLSFARRRR